MAVKSAGDGKLQVEISSTLVSNEALTDSGDHIKYTVTAGNRISRYSKGTVNREPVFYVDGIEKGGVVGAAASGSNDVVDVTAVTEAYINGNKITVLAASTDLAVARGASDYTISSICIDYNAGSPAWIVIAGTTHASAFSTTRGAAGGPPLIPVDHIEVGQVRYTSTTPAAVDEDEIFDSPNQHREVSSFPGYEIDYLDGSISFTEALPLIHTGAITKTVYAFTYYTPIFTTIENAYDFKPPTTTFGQDETQTYTSVNTQETTSKSTGSFSMLWDGKKTHILNQINQSKAFVKFFPDGNLADYEIGVCAISVAKDYTTAGAMKGDATLVGLTDWIEDDT